MRIHWTAHSIALGLSVTGCAMDIEWPSISWPQTRVETAARREDPAVDLAAPENLRATSGELRAVPLKWEPLLVGDVGGYLVERAATREGPFERIAQTRGRLATTYIDRDTVPLEPHVSAAPEDAANGGESGPPDTEESEPLHSEPTGSPSTHSPPVNDVPDVVQPKSKVKSS